VFLPVLDGVGTFLVFLIGERAIRFDSVLFDPDPFDTVPFNSVPFDPVLF
jgi:hypothetical protein